MATWKRLTDTSGKQVDVDLDHVAYMLPYDEHTMLHFSAAVAMTLSVKEKPDRIHVAETLRSRS